MMTSRSKTENRLTVLLGPATRSKKVLVRCVCGVEKEIHKKTIRAGAKRIYGCLCPPPTDASRRSLEWQRNNPERSRNNRLKSRYGITTEQRSALLDAQGGLCAICGSGDVKLFVDHCHNTGDVRGLLCRGCNSMIGFAGDLSERLIAGARYLEAKRPRRAA